MKLLCDTHVFIWLFAGDRKLLAATVDMIENPANGLYFSVASLWEAEIKKAKGKLDWPDDALAKLREVGVGLVDMAPPDALAAARLPRHHNDPFDRMIIAQAINRNLTIVTADAAFRDYPVPQIGA